MKKIYSIIALMLMCFVGNVNAQRWNPEGENLAEGELVAGEDQFYVIQEGDNTVVSKEDGSESAGPHSKQGYLSNNGCVAEVTPECIYNFIETGEEKEGFPIYVLKNVSNGRYLVGNNEYTNSMTKAFKFTLRKAVTFEGEMTKETPWIDYSNAVSATGSKYAEANGGWVFCRPDSRSYMCFWGAVEPNISEYIDTNNWLIFKAVEETMSASEKLIALFEKYFSNGCDEIIFHVGTDPGCMTPEFYAKVRAVYEAAEAATMNPSLPDEDVLKICADIEAIFADMPNHIVPMTAGYYVIRNVDGQERGFLTVTDDGKKGRGNKALKGQNDYASWTPSMVESWNASNAKYIWQLEEAKEEGKYFFKNFGTGEYLAATDDFSMGKEAETAYSVDNYSGIEFYFTLKDGQIMHAANHSNNKLMTYNKEDPASRWQLYTIDKMIVDTLSAKVKQDALNSTLKNLVATAEGDMASVKYKNGLIEDGFYRLPGDSGLVKTVLKGNSWATQEGSKTEDAAHGNLFDGKTNTYFHTAWSEGDVAAQGTTGQHWLRFDLGKEVKDLVIKFTKRQGAANNHINSYKLYTPEDGNGENEEYAKEIASSADSIMYQYGDSTTHMMKYTFAAPARYISFVVTSTRGSSAGSFDKLTSETGPFWHMSELRLYDAAECVDNPNFLLIPEATRNALTEAIAAAKVELEAKAATQATIDALDKALEAFWEAYPDASSLKSSLESNKEMAENAVEGETMGFFQAGAKQTLLDVIAEIEKAIAAIEGAGNSLTLEEIKKFEGQLETAVADFNSKLIAPEAGKIYQIVCKNGLNEDETEKDQNDGMVASVDADFYNGAPVWRYKQSAGEDTHFNTYWVVEKNEAGYAFKNLANGLYLNNVFYGLTDEEIKDLELKKNDLGYSTTPKYFTLESFTAEVFKGNGYFLMKLKDQVYLNFESTGKVVRWWNRNDVNSALQFVEVTQDEYNTSYNVDVTPGKAQVVTLPIDVANVYANQGAYTVLGINGNNLELSTIEGEVKAGTPFIVIPDAADVEAGEEGEKFIEVVLSNDKLADNMNLTYSYDVVEVNGLVSAPFGFETTKDQAYGVFIGKNVVASEGGDYIAGGTGFINNTVKTTTESGDAQLLIEGTITGEGTAVENVVIVKNVASDVYNVAGVKVRQNVKGAAATQGLPKGIYIVGGKKVVVK